jgi:hypothetical protein
MARSAASPPRTSPSEAADITDILDVKQANGRIDLLEPLYFSDCLLLCEAGSFCLLRCAVLICKYSLRYRARICQLQWLKTQTTTKGRGPFFDRRGRWLSWGQYGRREGRLRSQELIYPSSFLLSWSVASDVYRVPYSRGGVSDERNWHVASGSFSCFFTRGIKINKSGIGKRTKHGCTIPCVIQSTLKDCLFFLSVRRDHAKITRHTPRSRVSSSLQLLLWRLAQP